jgi:hypothetical protein
MQQTRELLEQTKVLMLQHAGGGSMLASGDKGSRESLARLTTSMVHKGRNRAQLIDSAPLFLTAHTVTTYAHPEALHQTRLSLSYIPNLCATQFRSPTDSRTNQHGQRPRQESCSPAAIGIQCLCRSRSASYSLKSWTPGQEGGHTIAAATQTRRWLVRWMGMQQRQERDAAGQDRDTVRGRPHANTAQTSLLAKLSSQQ